VLREGEADDQVVERALLCRWRQRASTLNLLISGKFDTITHRKNGFHIKKSCVSKINNDIFNTYETVELTK
jgi:hypothetical protein